MGKGTVFNIQKFSVNDGPGIRTTVFLKGCPLSCIWCHNPESGEIKPQIFYSSEKCVSCRKCSLVCENGCHIFEEKEHIYNREKCNACGKCATDCPSSALEKTGKEMTVDEVISGVIKDKIFYDTSNGGMTVSGGEPMYQPEFTYELLKAAKEKGIHTCIETSGFSSEKNYNKISKYVDIFLFDWKVTNPEKHKEFTGVSNGIILKNLKMLDKNGSKIILRCPIIPTLNDNGEHFAGIAEIANSLQNIMEINIEPYHPLGGGKAEMLGKGYQLKDLTFPEEKTVEEWIKSISAKTDVPVRKA